MSTRRHSWFSLIPFACLVVPLSTAREAFPQANATGDVAVNLFSQELHARNLMLGPEAELALRQRYFRLLATNKKMVDEKIRSPEGQKCIANYLNAMQRTIVIDQFDPATVQGFDWTYLLHENLDFASVKMTAQEPGYVAMLKAGDLEFETNIPFEKGQPKWLVVPIRSGRISLSLAGRGGAQTWVVQGVKPLEALEYTVPKFWMSKGCVLSIESDPKGATILFNGRKYHSKTNQRVVREPGAVTVVLCLEGYEDYTQEVECGKGDNPSIHVMLNKR